MVIKAAILSGLFIFLAVPGFPARAQGIPEKFTNLKVLPADISRQDLVAQMRGFAFSLGVRCDYCHAGKNGPDLKEMDFASDAKKEKATARTMMRMTQEINRTYIANISTPPQTVECVTCHRGSAHPRTLQVVLSREIDQNGLASALERYRQLRKENYGNGQFDFSETSLNLLSESLLRNKKPKEAAAFMELNEEVNHPLSKWGYSCLALAHQANQETQKAERDFTRILELDPHDAWAAGELKSIREAPKAN